MAPTICQQCGASLNPGGRFCGVCGAPAAGAGASDPLGRAPSSRARPATPQGPVSTQTLEDLGIPQHWQRDESGSGLAQAQWANGALVAGIALLPPVLVGLTLGAYSIAKGGPISNLFSLVGLISAFCFSGEVQVFPSGFGQGMAVQASASGFVLTITCASGALLLVGLRRTLGERQSSSLGASFGAVLPGAALFILGAVLLTALVNTASWPFTDIAPIEFDASTSLGRAFLVATVIAVLTAFAAVLSRLRHSVPEARRLWSYLSAPAFGVVVVLGASCVLALVAAAAFIVSQDNSRSGPLAPCLEAFSVIVNLALIALAAGTFSSVDAYAFDRFPGTGLDSVLLQAPVPDSFYGFTFSGGVTDAMNLNPIVGILTLVVVNCIGITGASAMTLRRRDAGAARRDLVAWAFLFFLVGLVTSVFCKLSYTYSGPASSAGIDVSDGVVFLLPLFSIGWWVLASLLLPRLPHNTLVTLSKWARRGL